MARLKNKGRCWLLFAGAGVSCYLHAIMPTLEPAKAELCGRSADAIQASDEISTAWWCLIGKDFHIHFAFNSSPLAPYCPRPELLLLRGKPLFHTDGTLAPQGQRSGREMGFVVKGLSRSKSRCCLLFAVNDGAASSWLLRWIKLHNCTSAQICARKVQIAFWLPDSKSGSWLHVEIYSIAIFMLLNGWKE